jgi:hypothetical protein
LPELIAICVSKTIKPITARHAQKMNAVANGVEALNKMAAICRTLVMK